MATKKVAKKIAKKSAPKKAVKKSSAPVMKAPDNNMYNLMTQLVQEQKSLWRIEHDYMLDAGKDADLKQFWDDVAEEKRILIADLEAIIAMSMM